MSDTIIARLASDGEAKLVRSLLETYGIPSTLSYDMPTLVYPLNVGEIRVAVPEGLGEEAISILAAHRSAQNLPQGPVAGASLHALDALLSNVDEEEEEDDDEDDDDWEDGGDDDDDDEGVEIDDEDDDDDDADDDLLDDEE